MIILIAFLLYVKKRIQIFRVFMVLNALEWTVASISLSQTKGDDINLNQMQNDTEN